MINEEKIRTEFEKEFRNRGYSIKRQEAGYIYESEGTEFASRGYEAGYEAALVTRPDVNQELVEALEKVLTLSKQAIAEGVCAWASILGDVRRVSNKALAKYKVKELCDSLPPYIPTKGTHLSVEEYRELAKVIAEQMEKFMAEPELEKQEIMREADSTNVQGLAKESGNAASLAKLIAEIEGRYKVFSLFLGMDSRAKTEAYKEVLELVRKYCVSDSSGNEAPKV